MDVNLQLHLIRRRGVSTIGESAYTPGTLSKGGRADLALRLLDSLDTHGSRSVVVAGTRYGGNQEFLSALSNRRLNWVVEIPRSSIVPTSSHSSGLVASQLISSVTKWKKTSVVSPTTGNAISYEVGHIAYVPLSNGLKARLFAAQTGAIRGVHRGTIIGLSSLVSRQLDELLRTILWVRWIWPLVRRGERKPQDRPTKTDRLSTGKARVELALRSNIKLARQYDEQASWSNAGESEHSSVCKGLLRKYARRLNVVELFAGAGGMGLGFLLAGGASGAYRLAFSGEINPIYCATLRSSHDFLVKALKNRSQVPEETRAIDLRLKRSLDIVCSSVDSVGETDVLIGGPPCQGFSNANRNSWHGANPHNELVDVFLRYLRRLAPKVVLMENVQGIVWTPRQGRAVHELTAVSSVVRRMEDAGYIVFPKLLDAVWYGVPQYRTRCFLLGIHRDLGYCRDDFGSWGPYPLPTHGPGTEREYSTVKDALRDLPRIGNGCGIEERDYSEPDPSVLAQNPYLRFIRLHANKRVISDHVTSQHGAYVLERYRKIPQGGNWEDIQSSLSNYSDVKRTHSNIYRRLSWNEPSITIGHYRKSMLVHPSQNRGLSLREAARLQSFPDWFRFQGSADGQNGGLMHKQQQLANAVCPLVTMAIADFLSWL